MNHILIVTSYLEGLDHMKSQLERMKYDMVICADGGYKVAESLNINIDIVIGDFDSSIEDEFNKYEKKINQSIEKIILPKEKDLTDTEASMELALTYNPTKITIIGGLGRRLDHTMGNIALLEKFSKSHKEIQTSIMDGMNYVSTFSPGSYKICKSNYKYIGLIPITEKVHSIKSKGLKYQLNNTSLSRASTMGLSNEIENEVAEIEFSKGTLMIIQCNDFL